MEIFVREESLSDGSLVFDVVLSDGSAEIVLRMPSKDAAESACWNLRSMLYVGKLESEK